MAKDALRHVVHRRVHLERSQVKGRRHLGLLEKHKDYVLRARDYHKKEKRLESLRGKTLERNPDEFYFKMISSQLDDKGRYQRKEKEESASVKKQRSYYDKNLVELKHSIQLQALSKAKNRLHHTTLPQKSSHTFFYEKDEEKEAIEPFINESNTTSTNDVILDETARVAVSLLDHQLKNQRLVKALPQATREASTVINDVLEAYHSVEDQQKTLRLLQKANEILETQAHLSTGGHVRKVKGSDGIRNIHRWEQRRKR